MGMEWGNMQRNIRGVITYHISPYEQRPFAGFLSKGFNNGIRRFWSQRLLALPFVFGFMAMDWGKKQYDADLRKNPKDYENEV